MCLHVVRSIIAFFLITGTLKVSASDGGISLSPRCFPDSMKNQNDTDTYFKLNMAVGDKIGNIFSRTISYRGEGFKEVVFRVSGTCVYTVLDNDPEKPLYNCNCRYDGREESNAKVKITNKGGTNIDEKGQSTEYRDASGILYNEFIWGAPPAVLTPGVSWNITLSQPWELGGPGVQKVTVIATDPANQSITLQREGNSTGFFENDMKQIKIVKDGNTVLMDVTPGPSHWTGYTIIKNGMVVSDELLVTRSITLTSGDIKLTADQREYMLLNQMPVAK